MPRGNKIQIRTGTGVPSPADFATSEPAWDGVSKLYIKSAAGSMVEIGGGGSGSSSLVVAASASAFPATGSESILYLDESTSRIFQWDSGFYVEVGGSGGGVSHASTHAIGGGDAITITSAQVSDFATAAAAAAPATTNASLLTSGTLGDARLSGNVVLASNAALTDARTPTAHASSHASGGSDALTLSVSQITGLGSLATANSVAYSSLTGTPSSFAPSSHTHTLSELTQSGATTGQVAAWNGTSWVASAPVGGISDGNKGDLTVSGSGETWTINANAVVTADIADGAVTPAKTTGIQKTITSGTTLPTGGSSGDIYLRHT